jgi:proteasome alpha subunit
MMNPYDWQDAMQNRVAYILNRIEKGAPVLAVSLDAGILIFTYRRQSQKIFEIYDRLGFAGLGQQSDIESIRVMAMEFAHKEGFTRSEQDVTVQRVVTAVSAPIKKAFADFSYSPILAISLFAELGSSPEQDSFFVVDFDGDYHLHKHSVTLSGQTSSKSNLHESIPPKTTIDKAVQLLQNEWLKLASSDGEQDVSLEDLTPEIMLMERNSTREDIFRNITS